MTYRDDREAIHQRVQQLEHDLERAQTEAAGRKEAQAEVERLRRVLAKAQGELERLRAPKPTPDVAAHRRRAVLIAVIAAVLLLLGAGAAVFMLAARPAADARVAAPPSTSVPVAVPPTPAPVPRQEPVPAEKPVAEPETEGDGLDRHAIQRVIRRNLGQVQRCYERELQDRPGLAGRVMVKFTIAGTGRVAAASVESSTLGNATVESCIASTVRRWTFPKSKDGRPVIVSYPFVFRSAGQ